MWEFVVHLWTRIALWGKTTRAKPTHKRICFFTKTFLPDFVIIWNIRWKMFSSIHVWYRELEFSGRNNLFSWLDRIKMWEFLVHLQTPFVDPTASKTTTIPESTATYGFSSSFFSSSLWGSLIILYLVLLFSILLIVIALY